MLVLLTSAAFAGSFADFIHSVPTLADDIHGFVRLTDPNHAAAASSGPLKFEPAPITAATILAVQPDLLAEYAAHPLTAPETPGYLERFGEILRESAEANPELHARLELARAVDGGRIDTLEELNVVGRSFFDNKRPATRMKALPAMSLGNRFVDPRSGLSVHGPVRRVPLLDALSAATLKIPPGENNYRRVAELVGWLIGREIESDAGDEEVGELLKFGRQARMNLVAQIPELANVRVPEDFYRDGDIMEWVAGLAARYGVKELPVVQIADPARASLN